MPWPPFLSASNPSTQKFSDSPAAGSSPLASPADHVHGFPANPFGGTTIISVSNGGTGLSAVAQNALLIGNGTALQPILAASSGLVLTSNPSPQPPSFQSFTQFSPQNLLPVVSGGTGSNNLSTYGVVVGRSQLPFTTVAPSSTTTYTFQSRGSSLDPAFAIEPTSGGGTGQTVFPQNALLLGNADGPIAVVSKSQATSGLVLTSKGQALPPSWDAFPLQATSAAPLDVVNGGTGLNNLTTYAIQSGNSNLSTYQIGASSSTYPLVSMGTSLNPNYSAGILALHIDTPLDVRSGGTGQNAVAAHVLLIGNGGGGLQPLPPSSSTYSLSSNGSNLDPSYGITTVIGGGTGQSNIPQNAVLIGNGSSPIKFVDPTLSTGKVLQHNGPGNAPTWVVPGWVPIADILLTAPQTSLTFLNIPQTYKHLMVLFSGRSDRAGNASDNLRLQFNLDTGNFYAWQLVRGNVSTASATNAGTQGSMLLGSITAANATASTPGQGFIFIQDYASLVFNKTLTSSIGNGDQPGSAEDIQNIQGTYSKTAGVTAMKIFPQVGTNLITGSRGTIYGLN